MTDDQGYGVSGTFGGIIHAGMDRIPSGATLHTVPLHCSMLADAGGADHRAQHHSVGFGRHRRIVHRLPGLRFIIGPENATIGESSKRTATPPRGWQEPTTHQASNTAVRPVPSSSGPRYGLPVFLRVHGRRDRPVDAIFVPRIIRKSSLGSERRITTHHDMADDAIRYMTT